MRLLFVAVVLAAGSVSTFAADKGTTVDLGGIKSTTPGDWKEEQPSSNMRMAQFKLPKADGDKDDLRRVVVGILDAFGVDHPFARDARRRLAGALY